MQNKIIDKDFYYQIFGLKPGAHIHDIKKAYRFIVKKNHPDLHPPEMKEWYKDKMIIINEAYQTLTKTHDKSIKHRVVVKEDNPENKNQLQFILKDPAYAYYKQGHTYFHRGFYKFYKKKAKTNIKLKASLEILNNFEKAYLYYNKVIDDYPESQWAWDSRVKMKKIEKLTPIYKKIKQFLLDCLENDRNDSEINIPGISILNSAEKWESFLNKE